VRGWVGALVSLGAVLGALVLAGCGGQSAVAHSAPARSPGTKVRAAITGPHSGDLDVPTSTDINIDAKDTAKTTVTLTDDTGQPVDGSLRGDGRAWVPAKQLDYDTRYIAKLHAMGANGAPVTSTVTFTTMSQPNNVVMVHSWIGDGQTVGVGMPVVLSFSHPIASDRRAEVQQRLSVLSDPPQVGAWNWFNDHEVHYRPREYWQPGTRLHVHAALGGLPVARDWFGSSTVDVDATVGRKVVMTVDNASKSMTVREDGKVVRTMPVSLGKATTPSSTGNMVVMTRNKAEMFDSSTFGIPVKSKEGYRVKVYWDLRLTWGGEYIHAAPWSVADQGVRNVSHGCVNLSTENAQWLFGLVHVGDPVITQGTGSPLRWGNGWTDWNIPFDEYVKGGATA
jgi:lipoprotein-anchoring transpeptidase ErfK/SrfK